MSSANAPNPTDTVHPAVSPITAAAATNQFNDAEYKAIGDQYNSIESRIAWDWLCGGNRHFGYYDKPTRWPFPISAGQRRMQSKLLEVLDLSADSHVLDAGCGDGHVAIDIARSGNLRITAFDVVERHVENAKKNVVAAGLHDRIAVEKLGFDHLNCIPEGIYDGVYTSEALLHATDAERVLTEFLRVLKPGGHLVLHEYHNDFMDGDLIGFPREIARAPVGQNVPAFTRARMYFEGVMERAGFEGVVVKNYSDNIGPMAKLLNVSAMWRRVVMGLRLQRFFPNTAAREEGYVGQQHWAYVSVSGRKPGVLNWV